MGTENTLFMRAARGEETERPPIWLMRQAGRSDPAYRQMREKIPCHLEMLFRQPELAAAISMLPVRWHVDAVIMFQDILTPLAGMGAPFIFRPGPRPDAPLQDITDFERLHLFDMAGELPFVARLLGMLRDGLNGGLPLLGFAGAPFTLLAFLAENGGPPVNLPRTRTLMAEYPEKTRRILDLLADMTIDYLKFQMEYGADAVQLFESLAHCLTPEEYVEWALPYQQRIFAAVKSTGNPCIFFARRNDTLLPAATLLASGATVLSLPAAYSIARVRAEIGDKASLQGNLDNYLLAEAAPVDILDAARACIKEGNCRGHIFNLSHGLLPHTPFENVQLLVDYVRGY